MAKVEIEFESTMEAEQFAANARQHLPAWANMQVGHDHTLEPEVCWLGEEECKIHRRPPWFEEMRNAEPQAEQPSIEDWRTLLSCTETLLQLAESAPMETWRNDVQDETGTLDEGQVLTGRLFERTANAIRAVGGYAGEPIRAEQPSGVDVASSAPQQKPGSSDADSDIA